MSWHVVQKLCVGGHGPCVDDAEGMQVACIGPHVAEAAAKASLIAAAPDLLEALEKLVNAADALADDANSNTIDAEIDAARAAIAKASLPLSPDSAGRKL